MLNNALIEISITPFFASVFGVVLFLLGALMMWRKLWEANESQRMRYTILAFSALVLCSGVSCFLLERDWSRTLSPGQKVPLYMLLAVSLCFALTFSLVDLVNMAADACAPGRQYPVSSPVQVALILAGSVTMGACFGLMFGVMDVEHDDARHRKLFKEERNSLPIGVIVGSIVGWLNELLATPGESASVEQQAVAQWARRQWASDVTQSKVSVG